MADTTATPDTAPAARTLPPFDPARLRRQLAVDRAATGVILVALGVALVGPWLAPGAIVSSALLLVALGGWLVLQIVNMRTWRELAQVTMLIDHDLGAAEDLLARGMSRWPMFHWMRMTLYQRLALIRRRQQRFGETGAICQHLLAAPVGPLRRARPQLTVMLIEAALETGRVFDAYHGLDLLHRTRLTLIEAMQRLSLQTRYEVGVGQDAAALWNLPQKIELAELMPYDACGRMHALLGIAAQRSGQEDTGRWLMDRALLLLGADELQRFVRAGGGGASTESDAGGVG